MRPATLAIPAAVIAALGAAACGGGADPALTVSGGVAGEARAGAEVAIYFEVESDREDAIVGVASPDAEAATLHELRPVDGGGIMMPSDRITLADGHTTLQPMGSHVMLSGLRRPLVAGDRIDLTLEFDHHATMPIVVEVVPLYELAELVADDR